MRITGWTFCDNPQYQEINNIDYDAVRRLVVEEIRKRGYKFSGYYHQGGEYGTPIIDGKYTVLYSYRSWGGIMADAYDLHNEDRLTNIANHLAYCRWAWVAPVDEASVFPRPKDYE